MHRHRHGLPTTNGCTDLTTCNSLFVSIWLLAGGDKVLLCRVLVFIFLCECGGETVSSSASEDIHNGFFGSLLLSIGYWYIWRFENWWYQCIRDGIKGSALPSYHQLIILYASSCTCMRSGIYGRIILQLPKVIGIAFLNLE